MVKKRLRHLLLFAVLFCFIFAIPSTVKAESLTDILYKFSQLWPDGSYFSTTGGPCGPGQTNSYCTYCQLAVMDWPAYEACGNADTCCGFANYVFYNIFGYAPRNVAKQKCTNVNDVAMPGDFVICVNSAGKYYHYFIYMGSAGGDEYYAYESNIGQENKVRYGLKHCREYGNLDAAYYLVAHAPNYDEINGHSTSPGPGKDTEKPVISDVSITNKTKNSITVKCKATDNIGITDVSFVVFPANSQPNDSSWHGCTNLGSGWWTYTYAVPAGGKYSIRLYGWDAAGNWGEYAVLDQIFDMAPPVIKDLSIQSGTVTCTVTDDVEVKQVRLAIRQNGGSTVWIDPFYSAMNISYYFTIPSENMLDGDSLTVQVHAWDTSNNEATSETETTYVDKEKPKLDDIKVTDDRDVYNVTCKVSYNKELRNATVQLYSEIEHSVVREVILKKQSSGIYSGSFKKIDNISSYDNYKLWITLNSADGTRLHITKPFMVEEKQHKHTPVKEADKPATCTSNGYVGATTCSSCGQVITERTIIYATGHSWGEWIVTRVATETQEGIETRTCLNDASHTETRTTARAAHTHTPVKEADKAATCTENGYTGATTCSSCGHVITERTIIYATGHIWGEWQVVKEPTATDAGLRIRVCKKDSDHIEKEELPATGEVEDSRIDVSQLNIRYHLSKAVYTGWPLRPIFVLSGDELLTEGKDYTIKYSDNVNVGTASAVVEGIGDYKGTRKVTFKITPAKNSFAVTPSSKTVSYSKLKSKNQSVTIKVTGAHEEAAVSFKLVYAPKSVKKYFSINKAGKLTVKKRLPKGAYKIKVRVTTAATANYKTTNVDHVIRIVVK